MFMPPEERGIYAPVGGWIPHAYYLVEVSVTRSNPVFRCLLYTGFLGVCGEPEGYSGFITHAGSDDDSSIHFLKVHYMKPLTLLAKEIDHELQPAPTNMVVESVPTKRPDRAERSRREAAYWKMHYAGDDEIVCIWPDGTWCLKEDLEDYLNPPCAMSDDYKEVHIDSKEAKQAIGE